MIVSASQWLLERRNEMFESVAKVCEAMALLPC
jgi:hypothetical protein